MKNPTSKKIANRFAVALFLLVLTVVLLIALVCFKGLWAKLQRSQHYQAVFLTNGQVYFGKMHTWNRHEVLLTDVHYIQVDETKTDAEKQSAATNPSTLSLIKLGSEVYGPTNRVYINKDHILFTEDLKDASQVVKIIQENIGK